MPKSQSSVLICGAGPSGLSMASLLKQYGVSFRIIDRNEGISSHSKALAIHSRTMEVFQDMGISDEVIKNSTLIKGLKLYDLDKPFGSIVLQKMDTPFCSIYICPQCTTERILLENIGGNDAVEWGTELANITIGDDKVNQVVIRKGQEEVTERFDYVIGCDGYHSTLRTSLKIPYSGYSIKDSFAIADIEVLEEIDKEWMHMRFLKGGICALIPLPNGSFRLILNQVPELAKRDIDKELILGILSERLGREIPLGNLEWSSRFNVHYFKAVRMKHKNMFLVGDSAHVHSPAGGQGMNVGIQDAYNLAWKLERVLHGDADPHLLTSYNYEREHIAQNVIETTKRLTKISTGKGLINKIIRYCLLPMMIKQKSFQKKISVELSELGHNYRGLPFFKNFVGIGLSKEKRALRKAPKAGDKSLDAKIEVIGNENITSFFQFLSGSQCHVVIFSGSSGKDLSGFKSDIKLDNSEFLMSMPHVRVSIVLTSLEDEIKSKWKGQIILDKEEQLHNKYGAFGSCLYLIRPDGYIGLKASTVNFLMLRKYLINFFE